MRFLALGPIEVRAGANLAAPVALGGAKPRALLAALLLQPRQVVSTERLIDLIWDERPPQSANALVHTYVSTLRRAFTGVGEPTVLTTRAPGYLLDLDRDDNDLEAFERHLAGARRHERDGDVASAGTGYERALRLWRGPAFDGVDAAFARARAVGLDQERIAAEEGLARSLLAQGHAADVTARLATLVGANPLREEAAGLLMRALYESGRQADALAVYRTAREELLEALGMEPGERLRALHSDILTGSLEPLGRPAADPADGARAEHLGQVAPRHRPHEVPRQLPPDIGDFTGRSEQIDALLRLAAPPAGSRTGTRTATPIVVVSGFGGAGKSALAVHVAHRLRETYPDGQLFADLRGGARATSGADHGPERPGERERTAHEVLGRFLGALGVNGADLPDDVHDRVELYRMRVAGRRLVILLDNARTEAQVRTLLPGSPDCLVIITSRSRLAGIEGAEQVELDFFSTEGSVQMLRAIVGAARVDAEPEAARTIATLCGGIPLALRTAAAKLLARPHWPLRALAGRLSDERRRLDELAAGDLAVRSSLWLNYAELTGHRRRAFHLLTLLDVPDFGAWLAGALLDTALDDAEDVVEQLVDLRLLDVGGVDAIGRVRYRFHDLVQLFGAEQAAREERDEDVQAAVSRALATWMALVEVGAKHLPRMTLGLRPGPQTDVEVDPRLTDEAVSSPTEWLKSETPALVRVIERAHELGVHETAGMITSLLSSPFAARNEFDGWQRTHDVALAAARRSGNEQSEAIILAGLGQLYYEKDEFATAAERFTAAAALAEKTGDDATRAVALVGIGTVQRDLLHTDEARASLADADALATSVGDLNVVAAAQYGLGSMARDLGDMTEAVTSLRRCAELCRELGDRRGEALALRGLSLCHRADGDPATAARLSREALRVLYLAGDIRGAAYAKQSLAKAMIRQRQLTGTREMLAGCLETCTAHRDRFGVALVTRTLGELALAEGDASRARELLISSLGQWRELALPVWQARTLRDLAAAEAADDPPLAAEYWRQALELFAGSGAREVAELAASSPSAFRDSVRVVGL